MSLLLRPYFCFASQVEKSCRFTCTYQAIPSPIRCLLMSSKTAGTMGKAVTTVAPKRTTAEKDAAAKMHRRSRSGMFGAQIDPVIKRLSFRYRMLYMSPKEEEVRRRERSVQSMQTLGSEMRIQKTVVVERCRQTEKLQRRNQEHHQAHEDDREVRAADGACGCGHSSRAIILFANICNLFSHPRHPCPLCRRRSLFTGFRLLAAARTL